MPELPEVETIVCELRPHLVGKPIRRVSIFDRTILSNLGIAAFVRRAEKAKISKLERRGKYIVFHLTPASCGLIAFHPRMTGAPLWATQTMPKPKHLRGFFEIGPGFLQFVDIRRFARLYWFASLKDFDLDRKLGPEPFEISAAEFRKMLAQHPKRRIKDLLLDQKVIVGVGNIYSDEALWFAKIHPFRKAGSISKSEADALFRGLIKILKSAIHAGGTSFRDYKKPSGKRGSFHSKLLVYNREGQSCARCGTPLVRQTIGSRGTRFCIKCQRINH